MVTPGRRVWDRASQTDSCHQRVQVRDGTRATTVQLSTRFLDGLGEERPCTREYGGFRKQVRPGPHGTVSAFGDSPPGPSQRGHFRFAAVAAQSRSKANSASSAAKVVCGVLHSSFIFENSTSRFITTHPLLTPVSILLCETVLNSVTWTQCSTSSGTYTILPLGHPADHHSIQHVF